MKLFAISDLHVGHPENRQAIVDLPPHPDDWLIAAGDLGDSLEQIDDALALLTGRFAQVIWTPGNHDLYTVEDDGPRGVDRYQQLVELCRRRGVLTPEDDYPLWPGDGGPHVIAPTFALYDYSFRPDDVPEGREIAWALESNLFCSDETYLYPDPFANRRAWCAARVELTEARLAEVAWRHPLVLVNHWPLLREHAKLPAVPRFSIWCGTRRTEEWHRRFGAAVVVYGHLHIRRTTLQNDTRFEEVSLGYPRQWRQRRGLQSYLREILPGPSRKSWLPW
ncbi:MAG: metallophosphoesterase [Pirellulales bacterium]|nr:metallophosphoesterase [Pirellulales bacterium]